MTKVYIMFYKIFKNSSFVGEISVPLPKFIIIISSSLVFVNRHPKNISTVVFTTFLYNKINPT
jgi:hypothetical protein